jgi:ABC-type transporter Mla subunit MlaD
MNNDRNALKAGTFIVVAAILALGVTVAIKDFGRGFAEPTHERSVRFKLSDDIGGLRVGDEVRVGGYRVGSVNSIEAVGINGDGKQEPALVITFNMPAKYVLRESAAVAVQTSLTGAAVLNVTDFGKGNVVADGVAVTGQPDPKSVLFNGLGEVTPRLQATVAKLQTETVPKVNDTVDAIGKAANTATETIAHARSKIDPGFDKYAAVTEPAGQAMAEVRDLIGDSKPDFRGTLANLNAATGTVKEKIPETMSRLNGVLAKIDDSVEKLQAALDDVKTTVANTKDVSASARAVLVGNRSRIDSVVASLKTTGDNLKAASSEIRRSPWRLLYKPAKGEMGNLNLYDAARQFAEGANDMNDAATALRDALGAKDIDEKQLQALVERLDKSFASFQTVEATLWERVKE